MPAKNTYANDPKSGANLVTIPTIHSLDPICYLLGDFKYLNATTAIAFPELVFIQEDGSKSQPVKRNSPDSISIQGVLESGATVSFAFSSTTEATPSRFEWIISGEKGALRFESVSSFLAMAPHTLYQSSPAQEGGQWKEVEVEKGSFGGIGAVYAGLAEGSRDVVDFDQAVERHKMVEAIFRSAKNGTRESY